MKIANAFSLSMLAGIEGDVDVRVSRVSAVEASALLRERGAESFVWHADTARILSSILGVEIPANRASATLSPGEQMLVAQYFGPRLPEGATTLPDGAEICFFVVERRNA